MRFVTFSLLFCATLVFATERRVPDYPIAIQRGNRLANVFASAFLECVSGPGIGPAATCLE